MLYPCSYSRHPTIALLSSQSCPLHSLPQPGLTWGSANCAPLYLRSVCRSILFLPYRIVLCDTIVSPELAGSYFVSLGVYEKVGLVNLLQKSGVSFVLFLYRSSPRFVKQYMISCRLLSPHQLPPLEQRRPQEQKSRKSDPRNKKHERERKKKNVLVTIHHPRLTAQQLLLAPEIGVVPSDLVAILLRLQQRNQMDARPHLLAAELELFAVAEEELAPAVGHDGQRGEGVVYWFRAAGGDIALSRRVSFLVSYGRGRVVRWVGGQRGRWGRTRGLV